LNRNLSDNEIAAYTRILTNMGAANTELSFRQNDDNLKAEILSEISKQDNAISEKDVAINRLRTELDKYKLNDSTLTKELHILFPSLSNVSIGKIEQYPNTDSVQMQCILLYRAPQKIEEEKLKN